MKPLRFLGFLIGLGLIILIVGPLVIPLPPLPDPVPVEELADPDSKFIEVNGVNIHYKISGSGKPAIILLHGFGASTFSWREVFQPLADTGTVVAYDRPAFGLTERPLPGDWQGNNPYTMESQVELTIGLMDALEIDKAILVGNSAGGTVALSTALKYADRITGLVLVDAAIYQGGGAPGFIRPFLNLPQFNRLGPYFARSLAGEQGQAFIQAAWHDPSRITEEIQAGYRKPLQVADWDKALWELTKASRASRLGDELNKVSVPVLVITGDDDRIVPTAESIRLAGELPNAELAVLPACGHVPQEECPQAFMDAIIPFLNKMP